jgi:hypothetical protein
VHGYIFKCDRGVKAPMGKGGQGEGGGEGVHSSFNFTAVTALEVEQKKPLKSTFMYLWMDSVWKK